MEAPGLGNSYTQGHQDLGAFHILVLLAHPPTHTPAQLPSFQGCEYMDHFFFKA